jgi:hypothetical protein
MALTGDIICQCGEKYVGSANGIRKLQNYCMRTTTEFTDIRLICKVVLFGFCGTRKTALNKQYIKLCVS